jgi:maltooligosyltrehalose trehalohydrolase
MSTDNTIGATYLGRDRTRFLVWAPFSERLEVHIIEPQERLISLNESGNGYFEAVAENTPIGTLYFFRLDGQSEYPDPASRFQPRGVHGPSQVVNPDFPWGDSHWHGLPLQKYITYEMHIGTFTSAGTFNAVVEHLEELKQLGITALELMPVAQFPGVRNWGYDGVYPFAVQDSYGGPDGLKRLVDACHRKELNVILDVVYNHLGPEGNYFSKFGPYFTDSYQTPWGAAINFDGPYSDEVRNYFIQNALYWLKEFHIDSLRLDAVHAIINASARPFLQELTTTVHELREELKRHIYIFAESNRNDTIYIHSPEYGGYNMDALWNDDFHHALHVLLTGEQNGYYRDFNGLGHFMKAFAEGFVYTGQYSAYHKRHHGTSSRDVPASKLLVFAQNHDQVGNRMHGERLSRLVSFEKLKLAAGAVLLSPFLPLLFMGEEYGEKAPFLYFVNHSDPGLIEATRQGRRREFSAFAWQGEPPDPQDEKTFLESKLDHGLRHQEQHGVLNELYKTIIHIRQESKALDCLDKDTMEVTNHEKENVMTVRRWADAEEVFIVFNFGDSQTSLKLSLPQGYWCKQLDSADPQWLGEGSLVPEQLDSEGEVTLPLNPQSFIVFSKEENHGR